MSHVWLLRHFFLVGGIVAYFVLHLAFIWSAHNATIAACIVFFGGFVITLIPEVGESWREGLRRAAERAAKDPRFPPK